MAASTMQNTKTQVEDLITVVELQESAACPPNLYFFSQSYREGEMLAEILGFRDLADSFARGPRYNELLGGAEGRQRNSDDLLFKLNTLLKRAMRPRVVVQIGPRQSWLFVDEQPCPIGDGDAQVVKVIVDKNGVLVRGEDINKLTEGKRPDKNVKSVASKLEDLGIPNPIYSLRGSGNGYGLKPEYIASIVP